MDSKKQRYIVTGVFSVLVLVLIGFAVDIEYKLYKMEQSEAVAVETYADVSESTSFDIYAFHEQLSENAGTTVPYFSEASQPVVTSQITTQEETTRPYSEVYPSVSEDVFSQAATTHEASSVPETTTPPTVSYYYAPTTQSVDSDPNFYRTESGKKYHRSNCSYLNNSRIIVTVEEITENGYEPCSRCMKGE